ncbi:MAG: Trm112 family protein [Phycisphaerae bacterium]|nr:Trm112 family protein [Phycisphaerae bacterium]
MNVDDKLLEILACPACRVKVERIENFIVCTQCRRRFPIRDELPIMLLSEAEEPKTDSSSSQA